MDEYKQFPISNFRTGFDESVEPWLLPRDAYQTMVNAHLYRGVLESIEGYTLFATMTRRNITQLSPPPDGANKTFTGTISTPLTTTFFGYGDIVAGTSAEKFTYLNDASSTLLNLQGSAGGTGTVNLTNGLVTLNFNTAPPGGNVYASDIFFESDVAVSPTAIMGIKQYIAANGSQTILVFDQLRVGQIVSVMGVVASNVGALQGISELPHDYYQTTMFTGDAATVTFFTNGLGNNAVLLQGLIHPGTVVFTQYTSAGVLVNSFTDNGVGGFTGTNVASGQINYITGNYTVTFSVAPAAGNYFDATSGHYGTLFTGSISNFFSLVNYQTKAFFTNSVDPIMYYDGTSVHYLNTNLEVKKVTASAGVPQYDITRCLHVFVNRERLLLINVTVNAIQATSTIFWSTAGNPLDFTNDEQLQASTSEPIRAIGFINSDLVVRFANSERVFRYTGDAFSPFRFDSTNNIFACDASYSSINYDSWFSSVGRPAIVGSDAVNVKRVDEIIPDFTDPTRLAQQTPVPFMNQTSIQQCYGERFDDLKEGWLCYNSQPVAQTTVTASDNVLAFSYLDNTYAVYQFPFSCLGFGRIINVPTWGTIFTEWADMADTWDSFQLTNNALIDLAGDQFDKVYQLGSGNSKGDGTTPVLMSVVSKNFNPFIEDGQLCRFGFVDLLVSANQIAKLRVQFYINDQLYVDSSGNPAGFYQESVLTFNPTDAMSPTTNQVKVWKRIYIGSVAKSHTIRFYQNAADFTPATLDQEIYIHAMVLWMKPAGRIFN